MDRDRARTLLKRLHEAQGEFYAGGADGAVRGLLAPEIEWHVPGDNAIAGDYLGVDQVMAYFARRRDLATGSFRMHPGDLLTGDDDHVASLTDGTATIGGVEHSWSTVGLYRFRDDDLLAACWLLPLDMRTFDAIWTNVRCARPFSGHSRSGAASGALAAPPEGCGQVMDVCPIEEKPNHP